METDFTSMKDRLDHFLAIFKSVKMELADFSDWSENERLLVNDFHDLVLEKSQDALDSCNRDCMIFGATGCQGIGEEFARVRNFLIFRIVEVVECRLLNDNSMTGLSLNEIHDHFSYEWDKERPFCFVWRLPLLQMRHKVYVPTEEDLKTHFELQREMEEIRRKNRPNV